MCQSSEECIVYVVDGNADSRVSLVCQLRAHGMRVAAFGCAEDFIENYDQFRAGCLILELNLPDMNGLALQDFLNQRQIPLPLIFNTSSRDVASAVTAIQNGAVDFLRKGPDISPLLNALSRVVRASRIGWPGGQRRHPYAPPNYASDNGRVFSTTPAVQSRHT